MCGSPSLRARGPVRGPGRRPLEGREGKGPGKKLEPAVSPEAELLQRQVAFSMKERPIVGATWHLFLPERFPRRPSSAKVSSRK